MAHATAGLRRYEERDDMQEPALDRLFDGLAHALRRRVVPGRMAQKIANRAAALDGGTTEGRLRELRYALRREGYGGAAAVDGCAAFAAMARVRGIPIAPEALGAAHAMLQGCVAGLSSRGERMQALAAAAWVQALSGLPVHVMTTGEAMSRELAALLQPITDASGLRVAAIAPADDPRARRAAYAADIVCAAARELGHDYLRDRLSLGARGHALRGMIDRLAADPGHRPEPLLPGLHSALVAEADVLMIDEAQLPLMLAADVQQQDTRLVYEQALEFARTLEAGAHYRLLPDGARLTHKGRARLTSLVASLGGAWRAEQGREELIEAALDALHGLERDRDYRIDNGAALFPPPDPEAGEDEAEAGALRQRMVEIKEGCALSGRREILSRLPLPRFLRRYVRLAGVGEDVRGLDGEFRALYRLRVAASAPVAERPVTVRVFRDAPARDAALARLARDAAVAGATATIAVRTPKHGHALAAALADAGIEPAAAAPDMKPQPGQPLMLLYPAHRSLDLRPLQGTHLVVAELHDARRHVRQLSRALEPSACTLVLSLDDEVFAASVKSLLQALKLRYRWTEELAAADALRLYGMGQRAAEQAYAHARLELLARDQQLSDLLAFSGQRD